MPELGTLIVFDPQAGDGVARPASGFWTWPEVLDHGRSVANKVIDPSTGALAPVGEQGELCFRGYHVMKGYFEMPEATREAIDADGWLHSG